MPDKKIAKGEAKQMLREMRALEAQNVTADLPTGPDNYTFGYNTDVTDTADFANAFNSAADGVQDEGERFGNAVKDEETEGRTVSNKEENSIGRPIM